MVDFGKRFVYFQDRYRKPDGRKYKHKDIERATDGYVTGDYITHLKQGRYENPSYERLRAISEVMGFPPELWYQPEADADGVGTTLRDKLKFLIDPQPELGGRQIYWPRGKVLGGSSARSYFLYQRATLGSLQKWADEVDDQSWTWDNMLPYYKKSVHFTPPNETLYVNSSNPYDSSAFDADGGPLQVSFSNAVDPFGTWCHKAFPLVGMPQIPGLSSGRLIGSSYAGLTIDPETGYRSSSEASFLQTAQISD